ncbi:MAG TPA: toxin [Candidatus Pacebacteria bacterium]|nr:toxin [Candidatus Paceibacterota bacterium]
MAFRINFNEEKNQLLKATRGICFEDVIEEMSDGNILANLVHYNQRYKHQKVFVVKIADYVYAVPYVINQSKKEIFLKTVYPSRFLTKKYLKGN